MYKGLNINKNILSNFGIYKYQEDICINIVKRILSTQYSYDEKTEIETSPLDKKENTEDVIILKSITGSGKTIMLIKILDILMELERNNNINKMNILWASNSAELNRQSLNKFWNNSKSNSFSSYFDEFNTFEINNQSSTLKDNTVGFINTQKLGKKANLNKESEKNGYQNFFDTLSKIKKDNLKILVIDECHNGLNEDGILSKIKTNYKPDVIIAASATPNKFKEYYSNKLVDKYTCKIFETDLEDVKSEGIIKDNIVLLKESIQEQNYSSTLTKIVIEDYFNIKAMWNKYSYKNPIDVNENTNIQKEPVILIQVEDKFEENINDFTKLVKDIIKYSEDKISYNNIYHSIIKKESPKQPIELLTPNKDSIEYIDASKIDSEKKLKVVIFKKNLQEGWDCPRAEILYSIRPVKSGKDIAQILGRVLRNPFKKNIIDEELKDLMSVYFYAPYYDNNLLKDIASEINDKIKIKETKNQIKKISYSFEIDENFINKVNNKKLPVFDKNEIKTPYKLLNNLLLKEKKSQKIKETICNKVIDEIIDSIKFNNIQQTISDSLNRTKVKLEDFFDEKYEYSNKKAIEKEKVLDDIDFKYKKIIKGLDLLDNNNPENSPLFNAVEDLYDEKKLNEEFKIIRKFYPEATDKQLVKIFLLTAIEHKSIKKIMNDIFKDQINKLRSESNLVTKNKEIETSTLILEKFIEKEFNKNNIVEYPKLNCALSNRKDKTKTIINKDSNLEEKVVNYLNKNLTAWIRNYTDFNSLKIAYEFEEEIRGFHPDFIGFDNEDNFTIIETKAKAFDDHIVKLKGTLKYCQKNNCALIWIIQHQKSYKKLNIAKVAENIDKLNTDNLLDYCDDLPL